MDEAAKKTALRMIPYGMFVLGTKGSDGKSFGAATINWATQTSFKPPLVAVGVKSDSGAHQQIKDTGVFAVNVIGKDQKDIAFTFFKPQEPQGNSLGGQEFELGNNTGCPLFLNLPAWWECRVVGEVARGDHTLFVGEVLEAGVRREDQTILMRDHNLNYGG
ncbi:MAG TPA: flavin reductase family protein [Candidatus Binatia bacterium]